MVEFHSGGRSSGLAWAKGAHREIAAARNAHVVLATGRTLGGEIEHLEIAVRGDNWIDKDIRALGAVADGATAKAVGARRGERETVLRAGDLHLPKRARARRRTDEPLFGAAWILAHTSIQETLAKRR